MRTLIFIFLAALLLSCRHSHSDTELERLDKEANEAMSTFNNEQVDSIASILLDMAVEYGNRLYEGKAHFYLSYMRQNLSDSITSLKLKHLDEAERIGDELGDDALLCRVYNQRGVWELSNMSPLTAQYWFSRSIDKGNSLRDRRLTIPAEMNMSEALRISGDTMGILYDRDLFKYANTHNLPQPLFAAAIHCAMHYSTLVEDTAELHPYIDVIRNMSDSYPGSTEMIYARFFLSKGSYEEAENYISLSNPERYADFLLLYGEILNRQKKYKESEEWLDKAFKARSQLFPNDYRKLLRLKASNMHGLGNDSEAFSMQKEYEVYSDSLEQSRTFDLVKRYRAEYEVATKDREIAEQKTYIRNLWLGGAGVLVLVGLCIGGYAFWQYRRNQFYNDIVRQNRDFIERQKRLTERIERRDARIAELTKETGEVRTDKGIAKISDEKSDELFERIQYFAEHEQVWRNVNITRDAFADMVGCNRTYFTEVLKGKTGMSYSQFMNACRVREAVRVLSEPADDTPLKTLSEQLGFITIQTFYTSFKKEIGMSPAAFRKSARNLD